MEVKEDDHTGGDDTNFEDIFDLMQDVEETPDSDEEQETQQGRPSPAMVPTTRLQSQNRWLRNADMMDENGICVSVDYAEGNINGTEDEIELTVALDSGAVDHVLASEHLPSSAEIRDVTGNRIGKTFVAANGQPMRTFGEVIIECEDAGGKSAASFAVTEVSRALQSVSRICDQDLEVLFTKREAKVRDPKTGKFVATYPRKGGLYTRTVKARAGRKPDARPRASPFTRPR